jgi:hypothetical protein
MPDEILYDKNGEDEQEEREHAAAKSGTPESGQPAAGGPQVTMRRMCTISMPPHQGTHDQHRDREQRNGFSHDVGPSLAIRLA